MLCLWTQNVGNSEASKNLPASRNVDLRHPVRPVAVDWQNPLEAMRQQECPAANKDFLALITHSHTSARCVGEFIRLDRSERQFGCTRHDRLSKRVFGLAFRNAGSGYDLPLPVTIG